MLFRSGSVIAFTDGKTEVQHIVLDFARTVDADYQIVPAPEPGATELERLYLPLLANHFRTQVAAVDYALTAVSNDTAATGVVLRPTHLAFATSGTLADGALSLYVQTDASGRDPGHPRARRCSDRHRSLRVRARCSPWRSRRAWS